MLPVIVQEGSMRKRGCVAYQASCDCYSLSISIMRILELLYVVQGCQLFLILEMSGISGHFQ